METGHQSIARAGSETSPDIEPRGERDEKDAAHQDRDLGRQPCDRRHDGEDDLHARADEEDVRDRADTGPLAQRNPQKQHEEPDDIRHPADADSGVDRDSLSKDRPGVDSESGLDGERTAGSVKDETDEELDDTTRHVTHPIG